MTITKECPLQKSDRLIRITITKECPSQKSDSATHTHEHPSPIALSTSAGLQSYSTNSKPTIPTIQTNFPQLFLWNVLVNQKRIKPNVLFYVRGRKFWCRLYIYFVRTFLSSYIFSFIGEISIFPFLLYARRHLSMS